MQNERGFTLVEILASIVILGLVATVFFQFFVFSQKTTTSNQEKLVALNVAQMVLERIKYGDYPELKTNTTFEYNDCSEDDQNCKDRLYIKVNNQEYFIKINVLRAVTQVGGDKELGIHEVEVRVYDDKNCPDDEKPESKVKGFVEL